jgi:hypothetical protein
MECETCELGWFNSKILEGLGSWIDFLVNELALNLVGGENGPPESLVQEAGCRLENTLGEVDVAAVLDDFLINQLGDLCCRVVGWAVQLVGLGCGAVILEHDLQRLTHINSLVS